MSGDEFLLFTQLKLRKFVIRQCDALSCVLQFVIQHSLSSHDIRKPWYQSDCDITEITRVKS